MLLQTRPDLVAQLRQRFLVSGMTRDQVHARLRTEGYPEDLLDSYLPGAAGDGAAPSDDVFRAVRQLGIVDSADVDRLVALSGRSANSARAGNSVIGDSLRLVVSARDSVRLAAAADSGFAIFGLDVFRSTTTQFDPATTGPVDANYRLGPLDRLVLILTGDVEASYSLDVTREGFIVIPQVGQIYVANLTLGQLEQVLASRLGRVYSGIRRDNQGTTRFSISVARLRSNQVYVLGDVLHPGSYVISSAGTALTALYAAAGPTINGTLRNVTIRRGDRVVSTLDVYDYLLRGDATHDVRLETGDVIFVPVHGDRVRIIGQIVRPATYELKAGETVADLLRYAGGLRATASQRRVLIERIVPASQRGENGRDRITLDVSSDALLANAGAGVRLQNGDVVHVLSIAARIRNRIAVTGSVFQPGAQGFTPGMRLSDALRNAGGVQPDTYLGEVLIARLRSDSTRMQLRAMLADTLGHVVNDLTLQEDDSITVFSVSSFRPDRFVSIGGAVRLGGTFPWREGMTLRDLVLQALGLVESADLKAAEIARLPANRDGGTTAVTIRVPLDSTYLFERKENGEYVGPPGVAAPASGAPEFLLKPYDNVLILRQPNWELQRTVVVQGEVRYPGTYALVRKSERLSDIIARAGGLTDEAYPEATVFSRAQYNLGHIGVDLPTALRRYDSADNLILRDGDTVNVRQYLSIVAIRGAVNQPTNVAWVRGKDIAYYINAAGGVARTGDEDRAYVLQPNGKYEATKTHFLLPASLPRPQAGAVVTVPVLDPADKKDFTTVAAQIGQIFAGLATIFILLKR